MSGIINRKVFVDRSKGYVKFHDWAMVATGLGVMAEPKMPFQRAGGEAGPSGAHDPTDQIWRVDEMLEMPMGKEQRIFIDDHGTTLHGGPQMPRSGY